MLTKKTAQNGSLNKENYNGREEGGVFLVDYFEYTFKVEFTEKTFTLYHNK